MCWGRMRPSSPRALELLPQRQHVRVHTFVAVLRKLLLFASNGTAHAAHTRSETLSAEKHAYTHGVHGVCALVYTRACADCMQHQIILVEINNPRTARDRRTCVHVCMCVGVCVCRGHTQQCISTPTAPQPARIAHYRCSSNSRPGLHESAEAYRPYADPLLTLC